eukprot:317195_1
MGKFTHAWKVSTHGGVRRSSGCPPNSSRGGKKFKGIFKKRSKLYSKKKYSSQARCTQMARTKEHRVKQLKQEQHADLQNNYNQLQQYSDDLYNIIGQYLGHEEISLLREKGNLINDSHRMDLIQFKMLIYNVYKCNVAYTQSNGFVAVIKALALLRKALCPDLAGQSSVISSIVFFLKKSKQYSIKFMERISIEG